MSVIMSDARQGGLPEVIGVLPSKDQADMWALPSVKAIMKADSVADWSPGTSRQSILYTHSYTGEHFIAIMKSSGPYRLQKRTALMLIWWHSITPFTQSACNSCSFHHFRKEHLALNSTASISPNGEISTLTVP